MKACTAKFDQIMKSGNSRFIIRIAEAQLSRIVCELLTARYLWSFECQNQMFVTQFFGAAVNHLVFSIYPTRPFDFDVILSHQTELHL